jgi:hypothetical protein
MRAASRRLNSEGLTRRRGETLHRCRKYPPSSRAREIGRMRAASVECPIPCDGGWRERSAGVGALHDERFTSVLGSGEMSDVVGRQERGKVAEGGQAPGGLSSIQMNPQLSHRKNTLLDKSATIVGVVCSHTGQRAVTSSGGRRFGSLGDGIGDQRSHIHVCRPVPHRYSDTPRATLRATGSVAPHDGQCFGDGSCSRRPLRVRAPRSWCARRSVVQRGLGYCMRARRFEHTQCR